MSNEIETSKQLGAASIAVLLPYYLPTVKEYLPAVILRPHGEVNPIGGAALLLDQLVEQQAVFVSRIEQQTSIPDHLLRAQTPDIHRASRQMITSLRPTTLHIHSLRAIPRRNDDGAFPS